jgi:hypothetical protein
VLAPTFDDDPRFGQAVEDLAVQKFVTELNGVTLIVRIASKTGRPCNNSTSTCLSFAMISSG